MEDKLRDIRIPVRVAGVEFKNPFYVSSGPTTKSVRQLVEIERTGWAAASIKLSIDPAPYINRKPRYALFKDRKALAFTAEKRLTFAEGLQLIREAKPLLHDLKLMANITYAGDEGTAGWVNMAKRFEEVYREGESDPVILPRGSQALYLIQRIRDEAHRFAITFHRQLRNKRNLVSVLDHIDGIGPKRRKLLLEHFSNIDKIKEASVAEMASLDGMTTPAAEAVFNFFNAKRLLS